MKKTKKITSEQTLEFDPRKWKFDKIKVSKLADKVEAIRQENNLRYLKELNGVQVLQ